MIDIYKQVLVVLISGCILTNVWAQNQNGVLILPFTINDKTQQPLLKKMIGDMLFSRLASENCTLVKDYRNLNMDLSKSLNIKQSKKIARANGLSQIITGTVSIFGGQYSIDAQIWEIDSQKPSFTHSIMASSEKDVIPRINELSQEIRKAICDEDMGSKIEQEQKKAIGPFSYDIFTLLDIAIQSLTVADVNHDNYPELIAADKHNVYMFDLSNNSIHLKGHFNADHTHKIFWLDSADIDNDKIPEFYVTAVHKLNGHLVSFVLQWNHNAFKVLCQNEPYYLRCFRRYDQTVHLIGQKQSLEHFFSKKICLLRFSNNKLIVEKTQFIPPNSHFASFHQGRFTGDDMNYVLIRSNNKMEILNASFRTKWSSQKLYAESKKMLIIPKKSRHKAAHENDKFFYLNQRIQIDDVDQDSIDEIIVSQQNASSGSRLFQRYRQFDSGLINCLKWNGLGMVSLWKTPEIIGYISDYFWFDRTGKGDMCLLVAAVSSKSFLKPASTQILLFEYQK